MVESWTRCGTSSSPSSRPALPPETNSSKLSIRPPCSLARTAKQASAGEKRGGQRLASAGSAAVVELVADLAVALGGGLQVLARKLARLLPQLLRHRRLGVSPTTAQRWGEAAGRV